MVQDHLFARMWADHHDRLSGDIGRGSDRLGTAFRRTGSALRRRGQLLAAAAAVALSGTAAFLDSLR